MSTREIQGLSYGVKGDYFLIGVKLLDKMNYQVALKSFYSSKLRIIYKLWK